jgi:hypothetical protein
LLYDADAKTVHIFHFVGFLEEQLRQTCSNTTISQLVHRPLFSTPS